MNLEVTVDTEFFFPNESKITWRNYHRPYNFSWIRISFLVSNQIFYSQDIVFVMPKPTPPMHFVSVQPPVNWKPFRLPIIPPKYLMSFAINSSGLTTDLCQQSSIIGSMFLSKCYLCEYRQQQWWLISSFHRHANRLSMSRTCSTSCASIS